jgi:hypothetical protein
LQAPIAATYTFNTRFDDGGELWLSPNADPRAAVRVVAVDSADEQSTADGSSAEASGFCDAWACGTRACFRSFFGFLSFENAGKTCADLGGLLGAPRSAAESALIISTMPVYAYYWIGLSDDGEEGKFSYSDGTFAGYDTKNAPPVGWSYTRWAGNQPDDHANQENCVEMHQVRWPL